MKRMIIVAAVFCLLGGLPWPGPASADEGAQKNAWLLEPALLSGSVHEFTRYAHTYAGAGLSIRYLRGPWIALGGYRTEKYAMTYFGITGQTVNEVFSGRQPSGPLLTGLTVEERRNVLELTVGWRSPEHGFAFLAGVRDHELVNSFSSMRSTGPCARIEGGLQIPGARVSWSVDGAYYTWARIENHRFGWDENEYALPDGERTTSYYGEPNYATGWGLFIGPREGAWKWFSLGYEGGVLALKYGYRHYHGISARGLF